MTFWALGGLINGIAATVFGLFVYLKNIKKPINKLWGFFSFTVALWGYSYFFWQISTDEPTALFWCRSLMVGVIFIPVAFLHFLLVWLEIYDHKKKLLGACYIVSILAFVLNYTPLFIKKFASISYFKFWPQAGIAYLPFVIFWVWLVFYCWYIMVRAMQNSSTGRQNQIKYVLLGAIIGFGGGFTNYPLWFGIRIPPYGNILISVYVGLMAYAIVRHQLMDIEVIIKKTLVFAGLFTFAFGIIVGIAMITQELLPQYFGISRLISLAISAVIIILSLRPIENFLINITNKYLFQKKYDPRKVLKDFSDEALTILNLDKLCRVTIHTLVNHLYLKNCAILLLIIEDLGYGVYDSFGIEKKGVYLDTESSLMKYLKNGKAPLLYESYDKSLQAPDSVKKDMDEIQSQLCIPLIIRDELVGVLSLGAKKSDQPYNADDIDILITLVKALSIAISNAKLFMQAAQNEKLAAIGTITSAINHEVCGPLNRVNVQIDIYAENKKRKVLKGEDALKKELEDAEKIMQNTTKEIKKVTAITSKLSGFAKPSNIVESKPIDIAQSVEDAFDLLRHKCELDSIKLEKNIPKDLSKIVADEDQMQQIFFNLIRNAAEAVKEKGIIAITAKESGGKVRIEIKDTGSGISEDKLNKIFEPFYTTKNTGSGYGLSVVKELVQRNNGNISVKSKVGEGTSFYLEFQKA